jgi:NADPH:quinone reductase-like Zn-dependent oxidoreductase
MAKVKLLGVDGEEVVHRMPAVKDVAPCASQVLIELLTVQEMMNTSLIVNNAKATPEFQGVVLKVGPMCQPDVFGFKVGNRVQLSGAGVPVPNYDGSHRQKILMDPNSIKAVLFE